MMITTNSYSYESTDGLSSNMEVSDNNKNQGGIYEFI